MTVKQPFNPAYGSTQTLTPAAASANVVIDADKTSKNLLIQNTGANIAFVRVGAGAQTATAADLPIPAGKSLVITKDQSHDNLAHISAAGTTLLVTRGEGWQ